MPSVLVVTGLLLRTQIARENNLRVLLLTENGKLWATATGAAKLLSKWNSQLVPPKFLTCEINPTKSKSLIISSVAVKRNFPNLTKSLATNAASLYLLEVIEAISIIEHPEAGIFQLAVNTFSALNQGCDPISLVNAFIIRSLALSGMLLDINEIPATIAPTIQWLLQAKWKEITSNLKVISQSDQLLAFDYGNHCLEDYLEKRVRCFKFLRQILVKNK